MPKLRLHELLIIAAISFLLWAWLLPPTGGNVDGWPREFARVLSWVYLFPLKPLASHGPPREPWFTFALLFSIGALNVAIAFAAKWVVKIGKLVKP